MSIRLLFGTLVLGLGAALAASCGGGDEGGDEGGKKQEQDASPDGDSSVGINLDGALDGTSSCKKLTCADLGITCGPAGDGCGGIIECGGCTPPETCGGGGKPSTCGGTTGCVPKTCADYGFDCGPAGDGCGGVIQCGTCTAPEICGGAGPSKCGGGQLKDGGPVSADGGPCTPSTTCAAGDCGPIADGCGGLHDCGACSGGNTCGGGGVPSKCGQPACTKTTCAALGLDCGFAADGCGGLLDCGGPNACTTGFCGGGGPNKCGVGTTPDGGTTCVNFCPLQVKCPGTTTTTLKGTVYAPNGTLPIPGGVVYVPNGSTTYPYGLKPFVDGVAAGTCDQCSAQASGSPLVSANVSFDGTFTLTNVPAGNNIPLVIQVGRWRRVVTVNVPACTTTNLTAAQTRLPTREAEGGSADHIPLFAIATGNVDALECVIRKLGVENTQFTNPNGNGRIRFYRDNGAVINGQTPSYTQLYGSQAELDKYDALIFACRGQSHDIANTAQHRVLDVATNTAAYVNKGGRAFFTHFSYSWLYDIAPSNALPWPGTTSSSVNAASWNNPVTGEIDVSFPKGQTFAQWLGVPAVNALSGTNPARVAVDEARRNMGNPLGNVPAQRWIFNYQNNPAAATLHLTFNTPWGAQPQNQCGRVLFSSFHVTTNSNTNNVTFPNECNNSPMTPQEKVLAFMLFDLTSCITPDQPPPPSCTPLTCAQQNIGCGLAGNGCGGQLNCGPCPVGQVCQGNPPACKPPPCTKTTCAAKNAQCGFIADGCGGQLDCGPCPPGQICGGSGPNQCGLQSCTPTTCAAQGIGCGPAGDGCGGLLDCGPCPPGQTCGGGGVPGQCGTPSCTPGTCQMAGANCGYIADGCGGILDCGPCPPGQTCGGGGVPNQCGGTPIK